MIVNVNIVDFGVNQKVEVTKAALFSDYLKILKVDVRPKATTEYPLIEPISLIATNNTFNETEILK
jgi:hypothetical protein